MADFPDTTSRTSSPQCLAVSPSEAARLAGIGRTTLYEAIGSGALRSLKIGKRRLITVEALRDWLGGLEHGGGDAR